MIPKLIKTEKEYNEAVKRIEFLMDREALNDRETNDLELLSYLVSVYEDEKWPILHPDPVTAILFRIEQKGLDRGDLEQYIGSKGRVSEVLSGKRQLSKQMIINLHNGLGIPYESLIGGSDESGQSSFVACESDNWMKYPVKEIVKRGWVDSVKVKEDPEFYGSVMKKFVSGLGVDLLEPAMLRTGKQYKKTPDIYALTAWRIRVLSLARQEKLKAVYEPGIITPSFCRELASLSYLDNGPLHAKEFLNKSGIHFIIESHLDHTYLDGAAMMLGNGSPVIALTLRYDRLDNFWFVLFHELAHVVLHLAFDKTRYFLEDLDSIGDSIEEKEADRWATDGLIDPETWRASGLSMYSKPSEIIRFANSLRINHAIPAGRLRKESGDYKIFYNLVGKDEVRKLFWSECE
jgi:HTH-type transcriptional regulator/antitoxin HigA